MNTDSSRETILARIKAAHPAPVPHPEVKMYRISGDAIENFETGLRASDGTMQRFASREAALEWLGRQIDLNKSTVFSAIPDFKGNISADRLPKPHDAHIIDICVAEGELGVGETGSVWVTDRSLGLTAAALFSTDLYLLLDSADVVDGIHEAYRRIDLGSRQYGAFYTGPSATADIEAVHITGAQAAISLTVLLY